MFTRPSIWGNCLPASRPSCRKERSVSVTFSYFVCKYSVEFVWTFRFDSQVTVLLGIELWVDGYFSQQHGFLGSIFAVQTDRDFAVHLWLWDLVSAFDFLHFYWYESRCWLVFIFPAYLLDLESRLCFANSRGHFWAVMYWVTSLPGRSAFSWVSSWTMSPHLSLFPIFALQAARG